jgi:hydroxymethylpyrimidine/phosphomethylpyrimidine kinase
MAKTIPATRVANVLSIAGSDCGGGAGVAMDLKVFAARGVHGLCAITAVTAQTSSRVASIHCVPARHLEHQLHAVFAEYDVAAIKIGMLASAANVRMVARFLRARRAPHVVLDPLLAASSGNALLSVPGLRCLREELFPHVDLLTPNLPEAQCLLGKRIADPIRAANALRRLGVPAVLLKGGHAHGNIVRDVLVDADGVTEIRHPRLHWSARGTGCALSSAIAAGLARSLALRDAVAAAEAFVQRALVNSYTPGKGQMRVLSTTI